MIESDDSILLARWNYKEFARRFGHIVRLSKATQRDRQIVRETNRLAVK
jgi:hypothetical protein